VRRSEVLGHVGEEHEHLQLPVGLRRHEHRVVEVVAVQVLVVVGGPGVLGPRLGRVEAQVVAVQQRTGQRGQSLVDGQQADLGTEEREGVDPGELVAEVALPARVAAFVEAPCRREHQLQLRDRRPQRRVGQVAGQDDEPVPPPVA
jgi:hypothetical protein